MGKASTKLAAKARGHAQSRCFVQLKRACIVVQCWARRTLCEVMFRRHIRAAVLVQKSGRRFLQLRAYALLVHETRAAIFVQKRIRGFHRMLLIERLR
jgi:hypothetical protein